MKYPTMDRFAFQRQCVDNTSGKVINIGCCEDPAQLKSKYPDRVTNLDLYPYNIGKFIYEEKKVPIPVDIIHNILRFPYPFVDNEFGLAVLGDVLEDLPDSECQLDVLKEVHRIAEYVCITTPEDSKERDWHHFTTITEDRLRTWLSKSNWTPFQFLVVDYVFVPKGYLVFAKRN